VVVLLGAALAAAAFGREPTFEEYRAVRDSLRSVPPKMRMEWLHQRGIEVPRVCPTTADSGLTLIGKWGRGPSAEVTGKDTLVVLTLGSEVALLSFAKPDSPRVLSEIQFPSLTAQSCLKDSLLYSSSNADLEIWNVADPTQPVKRGQLLGQVGDFWIRDTFLYYIRRDTFHVLSVTNPANPYELGSCVESGSATTGSGNTVVVCRSTGFAFVDVSDPTSPHEVGSYPCGYALSATARGNLVCASYEDNSYPYPVRFITLDISTPSSPALLAKLNDLGGYDIFLDGPLAFVSGRDQSDEPFQIISIVDSTHPAFVDSCRTTQDANWGVWSSPSLDRAFVANGGDGLAVVDVSNLNNPVLDTYALVAATAEDVAVQGAYCYVADGLAGFRVLDVSNPTVPHEVGSLDTSYLGSWSYSVAVQDSFAFFNLYHPWFRTADISDPTNPRLAGGCSYPPNEEPQDIVVRDSFAYAAMHYDFNVINVARPRTPVVVGTCDLPEHSREVILADTIAYVANLFSVTALSIAQPTSPRIIGTWEGRPNGIDLHDTILYAVAPETLWSLSVSDPSAPHVLGFAPVPRYMHDVVVVDTIAYCAGWEMAFVSVADPRNLRRLPGGWAPPSWVRCVVSVPPYLYACCTEGGVCILETLQTGIAEPGRTEAVQVQKGASVVRGVLFLPTASSHNPQSTSWLLDVSGRKVQDLHLGANDVRALAPGVYFIRQALGVKRDAPDVTKVIITQ